MAKNSKSKRSEVYRDHSSQQILSKFLSGEITKLEPVYDPKYGYRYPIVEAVMGDPFAAEKVLNHMYEIGILKRETFDKVIFCSKCHSQKISGWYCCPYCKSYNIKKSSLIEHIQCGCIASGDQFKKDDKLICPRCQKELTEQGIDYKRAGVWCICSECGKSFDIPTPMHFCRECHQSFMFEDILYESVYSYILNEAVLKEVETGYILVTPIREFLEKYGFKVESPCFLQGKSGATHIFDLTASRVGITPSIIAIDLALSLEEAVSEQSVIAMFPKVFDVTPDKACLIAIPAMNDNGRKLASLYRIELIEAKNQKDAIKALEACL